MKRLLITGNSHVAAIRAGWESMPNKPDNVAIDFLAARPTLSRRFSFDGTGQFGITDRKDIPTGWLKAAEAFSGSLTRTISHYTHVIVVGIDWSNTAVLSMIADNDIDGIRTVPKSSARLSKAAFETFSVALAWAAFPHYLVEGFRQLKIGLAGKPRRNDDLAAVDPALESYVQHLAANPVGVKEALRLHGAGLARRCAEQGVHLFLQPEETWSDCGLTKKEYSRGLGHIFRQDRTIPDDTVHMNAEYGMLCLARYLGWMANDD